jgi:hypothetical protein
MTAVRIASWLSLCSVVAGLPAADLKGPDSIAGKWRSLETSRGGLGALYEFLPDGNFRYATGAIVTGRYQLEDRKLTIVLDDKPAARPAPQTYTVEVLDAARLKYTDGKVSTEFRRVGEAEVPKLWIVGTWTQPAPEFEQADRIVRFDARGGYLMTIPIRPRSGYYKLMPGRQIWLNYIGSGQVEGPVTLEGDILTLPSASGKSLQFQRYR